MNKIEQQVMAAVLVIHGVRALLSVAALKVYALAASVVGLLTLVSLPHFIANLEQVGLAGLATFFFVAFVKTGVVVRLAMLVGAIALSSLLVDIIRRMPRPRALTI